MIFTVVLFDYVSKSSVRFMPMCRVVVASSDSKEVEWEEVTSSLNSNRRNCVCVCTFVHAGVRAGVWVCVCACVRTMVCAIIQESTFRNSVSLSQTVTKACLGGW